MKTGGEKLNTACLYSYDVTEQVELVAAVVTSGREAVGEEMTWNWERSF